MDGQPKDRQKRKEDGVDDDRWRREARHRDGQTKFQTDRGQTDGRGRKTDGWTDEISNRWKTDRQKRKWADKISNGWKNRQMEKEDRGTDRQTEKEMCGQNFKRKRKTEGQTDRQMKFQTD